MMFEFAIRTKTAHEPEMNNNHTAIAENNWF